MSSDKHLGKYHVSIEEHPQTDEFSELSDDDSYETYTKSTETLHSFREMQRSRHDTIAMQELREYLDRISRRRTGYGIDPYVQRVMAAPPRRTLLRNRKTEARPSTLVGALPELLRQPRGLTKQDLLTLLDEAADRLRRYTAAAVSRVYLVQGDRLHLHRHVGEVEGLPEAPLPVVVGDTTVGYVAASGDMTLLESVAEATQDRRFPRGLPWAPPGALASACLVPLCDDAVQRRCRAVVVLAQVVDARMQLGWKDVTAAVCVLSCLGGAVGLCGARSVAQAIADQQDELLRLLLSFFAGKANVPVTLAQMLRMVKGEIGAARGMIFLLDPDDITKANLFREPLHPSPELIKRDAKVSLTEEALAVMEAAQSGEPVVLNAMQLRDAHRLSRHLMPRGRIRAGALCLPLAAQPGYPAFAVVVLADKTVPSAEEGEEGPELDFAGFRVEEARRWMSESGCAALLSLVTGLARREVGAAQPLRPQGQVLRGSLSHVLRPQPATLRAHAHTRPLPPAFREFGWAPQPHGYFQHVDGVHLALAAAEDLLGGEDEIGPRSVWTELVYTVAICYRDVPYHNFRTALSILQCVYAILRRNEVFFTDLELQAMFMAGLCIHLDHRGVTDQFLKESDHPLSHCYQPPIIHNHHFEVLKIILDSQPVFPHTDREQLLAEIKCALLATEVTAYFRTRRRLLRLLRRNEFFWSELPHRRLVKDALMAAAVHSALCKNYPDNSRAADLLAEEWFQQGDQERELGLEPLPVMDRELAEARGGVSAADALSLVEALCAPSAELLTLALANTKPMLRLALATARYWRGVGEGRRRRSTDTGRASIERERVRRSTATGGVAGGSAGSGYSTSRDRQGPFRFRDFFW